MALRHPAIEQAAALPVPDPRLGERVCLAVVPRDDMRSSTPTTILEHLDAAGLSQYDMPEFILCVAEMPLTASGKIVKRELVRWVDRGPGAAATGALQRRPAAAEG